MRKRTFAAIALAIGGAALLTSVELKAEISYEQVAESMHQHCMMVARHAEVVYDIADNGTTAEAIFTEFPEMDLVERRMVKFVMQLHQWDVGSNTAAADVYRKCMRESLDK